MGNREGGELSDFLKRIQAGDEGAARELLQRFEAEVRLVVRRQLPRLLRSRFDSLDFLQSVWGSFFRRMRTSPTEFEDSRHLVAFLARAAKNKVIDEYRRAASRKHDMHREEPLWGDGGAPEEVADSIDSPSEVAEAHEVLRPDARAGAGREAIDPGAEGRGLFEQGHRRAARDQRADGAARPGGLAAAHGDGVGEPVNEPVRRPADVGRGSVARRRPPGPKIRASLARFGAMPRRRPNLA